MVAAREVTLTSSEPLSDATPFRMYKPSRMPG